MVSPGKIISANDLLAVNFNRNVRGNWRLDMKMLTLTNKARHYEIDLERIITAADVLDWIMQIAEKAGPGWQVRNFLWLLERAVELRFGESLRTVFAQPNRKLPWKDK